jgi:hypothetical protein
VTDSPIQPFPFGASLIFFVELLLDVVGASLLIELQQARFCAFHIFV